MANFEQINFKNGEAPYLSKQNLNEIQTRMNKALNDTEKEVDEKITTKINDASLGLNEKKIIEIIPLIGKNHAGLGNSYYYKIGTRVHIHLGINTAVATRNHIYTLPEGFRPRNNMCVWGGGSDGVKLEESYIEFYTDGKIYANTPSKFILADIEYDVFN